MDKNAAPCMTQWHCGTNKCDSTVGGIRDSCKYWCGLGGLRDDDGYYWQQRLNDEGNHDNHLPCRLCHHLSERSARCGVYGRPCGCRQRRRAARVHQCQHLYVHPEGLAKGRPVERCWGTSSPGHAEPDRSREPFRFLGDFGTRGDCDGARPGGQWQRRKCDVCDLPLVRCNASWLDPINAAGLVPINESGGRPTSLYNRPSRVRHNLGLSRGPRRHWTDRLTKSLDCDSPLIPKSQITSMVLACLGHPMARSKSPGICEAARSAYNTGQAVPTRPARYHAGRHAPSFMAHHQPSRRLGHERRSCSRVPRTRSSLRPGGSPPGSARPARMGAARRGARSTPPTRSQSSGSRNGIPWLRHATDTPRSPRLPWRLGSIWRCRGRSRGASRLTPQLCREPFRRLTVTHIMAACGVSSRKGWCACEGVGCKSG